MNLQLLILFIFLCSFGFAQDALKEPADSLFKERGPGEIRLSSCTSRKERNKLYKHLMDSVRITMSNQEIKMDTLYLQGKGDAKKYYMAQFGIFMRLTGYVGMTVYLASTPWKLKGLGSPNKELLDDPIYYTGYKHGVRRKKAGKLLLGIAIGIPVSILAVYYLVKQETL